MFSKISRGKLLFISTAKSFSTSSQLNRKVAVLGASGGIGQPLCLLLKQSPYITELAMYDVLHSPGVAADLGHIPTPCRVSGYGPGLLREALNGADVVIVAAGIARKPGQTREDQFVVNSRIVKDIATTCAQALPNAIYGIISNPINSIVPLFSEVFRKAGVLNEKKILGITTLGVLRTSTFIAQEKKISDPSTIVCPVIGGHSGVTIVPVLSQCSPKVDLPTEKHKLLVMRVRQAGTDVVQAKEGSGTVTLSMAFSGARFTNSLLQAMKGKDNIIECAYVRSDVTKAKYFSNPLLLGPNGVEKNLGIGTLSPYENELLEEALPVLIKYIADGENFASQRI